MKYAIACLLFPFSLIVCGQCTASNAITMLEVMQSLEGSGITSGNDLTFCIQDSEAYIFNILPEDIVTVQLSEIVGSSMDQTASYNGGDGGILIDADILFTATFIAQQTGEIEIIYDEDVESSSVMVDVIGPPAQLDPSPWEIIVADMVANNPHEVARAYDFTVGDNQLPIRLSENMDCPTETGPTRFSIEFTDIDTGQEIGVLDEKCEVVVLFSGQNVTVNFTPVSPGSDLLEWQDDNGVTQTATPTSSATPCDGPAATVASIGQDLLTNPIAVGETRSYCFLNSSPGSLIAMPAPTQTSGILSATVTVLSGTDTGYSVEDYTGGEGGLQLSQGQNEFVRFDFTGVSAGSVLIEVENGAEFFEETITVLPAVLPVELITFSGVATSKNTLLHFTTASESANRGFHLQHSPNGQNWTTLDFIPGAGDSQAERDYAYTHLNPAPGTNYYRLEQEDFDGTRTLSEVVTANFTGDLLSVFPNPGSAGILRLEIPEAYQDGTVYLYTMSGTEMQQQSARKMMLSTASLPTGVYLLRVRGQSGELVERILVR